MCEVKVFIDTSHAFQGTHFWQKDYALFPVWHNPLMIQIVSWQPRLQTFSNGRNDTGTR
jgi:hypothetical protein